MDEALQPDTENYDVVHTTSNITDTLSEDKLKEIGEQCKAGFEYDLESRESWENDVDLWISLAKQDKDIKTYPWPKAANVKYPLISTAAMQFAARAYPSLVPSNGKLVKTVVIGKDTTGEKYEKAERVSTFMSWQILHDMPGWEEDMDKMLMQLPVVGCMFKKTWYSKEDSKVLSKLIMPKNFVVNYWTKDLETTERTSEIIEISQRLLKERQLQKIFRDVDLGSPQRPELEEDAVAHDQDTVPYTIIEQHTFLDLDDSGYKHPYIVTFERYTGEVLNIQRRYLLSDVELADDQKTIVKIKPIQMYTKFGFVPNPDGSFYDIGFGVLLGSINESVNTLINQLIDGGSLNNLQAGFISKTLRMRMGDAGFKPGEWKPVNATGDDIRKQIVPLPTKEPSAVLLKLLELLITSGKELASVAEIFTGKMPGQNTPATTTMATVEQGMKVFTAVYKRIFRALGEEFKKIFNLNKTYIDPQTETAVLDAPIGPDDFDIEAYDICPGADPTATSQTEKLQKAQGLIEMLQVFGPMMNPIEVLTRVLEAQEQPNYQKLFSVEVQQTGQVPPPPPDPKLMAIQAKAQADQQKAQADIQFKQQEMELNARDKQQQMLMAQQEHAQKMQHEAESAQIKSASDIAMSRVFMAQAQAKGQQQLQQSDEQHKAKLQQSKEIAKSKPQPAKK